MTDTERLAEIRERCERATAGPWRCPDDRPDPEVYSPDGLWITNQICSGAEDSENDGQGNGQFIAHARDDVPYLLALVDRLAQLVSVPIVCGDEIRINLYDRLWTLRGPQDLTGLSATLIVTACEIHGIAVPEWLQSASIERRESSAQ